MMEQGLPLGNVGHLGTNSAATFKKDHALWDRVHDHLFVGSVAANYQYCRES